MNLEVYEVYSSTLGSMFFYKQDMTWLNIIYVDCASLHIG